MEGKVEPANQLRQIIVAEDNPSYCSLDGVLFTKDMNTLVIYPGGKEGAYTVPDGVRNISTNAFSGHSKLTEIVLCGGMEIIEPLAFMNCTSLSSIILPTSLSQIGYMAFYLCSAITDVYYLGDEEAWSEIQIGISNDPLLDAQMHFAVSTALVILTQPMDYAGPVGSIASFTVEAQGAEPLTYQWWVKKPSSSRFSKSSITGPVYEVELTEARDGNQLYCVVTDAYGNIERTNTVSMAIIDPLAITMQPEDYVGPVGSTASFTVEASGSGLIYQWYVKKPTASRFSKSSITGPTYEVELTQARNGNQIYCVVTDAFGNAVRTDTVTMTIG